jgi:hypothetical protein
MLCRNRVADFDHWRAVFASHASAHRQSGLHLRHLWRSTADPNNVFFLFELETIDKAKEFIGNSDAKRAASESGVIDGEYHFLNDSMGYADIQG